MSTDHGRWIWYELMTPDPAASGIFYRAVVGWTVLPPAPANPGYSFLQNPDGGLTGGLLHLTADMAAHGARPCWLGYIAVDDFDAALRAITAAGGRTLMPARDIAMAGRIAMVADPAGSPFYVMTPNPPPGAPQQSTAFSPDRPGRCAWNELLTTDQAGAIRFYTAIFGWGLRPPMDMGAMGTYQFMTHGDTQIGAIMTKPPQAPAAIWQHYMRVPDIMVARDAILANGGTVLMGPMEVPGGDHIIQGLDPQGALFALVGKMA